MSQRQWRRVLQVSSTDHHDTGKGVGLVIEHVAQVVQRWGLTRLPALQPRQCASLSGKYRSRIG